MRSRRQRTRRWMKCCLCARADRVKVLERSSCETLLSTGTTRFTSFRSCSSSPLLTDITNPTTGEEKKEKKIRDIQQTTSETKKKINK